MTKKMVGKILVNTWGCGMTINDFCEVIRETDSNMWCAPLETIEKGSDKYNQFGTEKPIKGKKKKNGKVKRIKKDVWYSYIGSSRGDSGQKQLWTEWDGKPESFNYMD